MARQDVGQSKRPSATEQQADFNNPTTRTHREGNVTGGEQKDTKQDSSRQTKKQK